MGIDVSAALILLGTVLFIAFEKPLIQCLGGAIVVLAWVYGAVAILTGVQ